jgi:hypothetical protein
MRAFLPFLVLAVGCGKQIGAYEVAPVPQAPVAVDAKTALLAEADALWEERGDKAKLQAALAKYEQLYGMDATDRHVAGRLLRGWYFLGDGHETEKDAQIAAWATAIEWGKKCLAINADFTARLAKGDEDEATAAVAFTKDDVPCLYWTSSALGKWAKASGMPTTLRHLPTVKAYMARVGELDASYYFNGPDRYWGAYYAAIPSFAGQDLNKSKEYFDKAIAANPAFLGNYVLLAENWATKTQNGAEFDALLKKVAEADASAIPEIRAEAEAEKRKAAALVARRGDFFAE